MQDDTEAHLYERLIVTHERQNEDLRRENDDLRQSLAVERKRNGFGGVLSGAGANALYGGMVVLVTQTWVRFRPYYLGHMPTVWGYGFVALWFSILAVSLGLLGRNLYREWSQARAAGGALAAYHVQFKYSSILGLSGLMMLIFARGGPSPAASQHFALEMMLLGAAGMGYNYCRGKRLALMASVAFPSLR